jgi:hypothetical protein
MILCNAERGGIPSFYWFGIKLARKCKLAEDGERSEIRI